MPVGVQDIGAFQQCFETIAKLAILSNAGLVFFTMRDVYFEGRSDAFVAWCFFGTQIVIVYLLSVVENVFSDVPESVNVQLERQAYIKEAFFDPEPIEEEDSASESGNEGEGGAADSAGPTDNDGSNQVGGSSDHGGGSGAGDRSGPSQPNSTYVAL